MVRNINQLPDEIISHILSFLTVRDAIRARLSSSKWLHLPDSRSVLHFDCLSVLGKIHEFSSKTKFVRIVDQFMQSFWAGNRISRFILSYHFGLKHSSLVNRWVAACIRMKVEEIQLSYVALDPDKKRHVFPSHLLHSGNLKELTLKCCSTSLSFQSRTWLCNLTKLHLSQVLLNEDGWGHILAAGSNLISLTLWLCQFPKNYFIDGQLPSLKNLVIYDMDIGDIRLDCPNLEVFEYTGPKCDISFAHVPFLREAKVWFTVQMPRHHKRLFMDITRNAPMLQTLSLWISSEVRPFRTITAKPSLKKLNLLVHAPYGYDILNVIPFLNACPFVETFGLKMVWAASARHNPRREYPDQPHAHLKHVKIEGFRNQRCEMDLATYLLRNAVTLEQMVIVVASPKTKEEASALMERHIHPTAQVIIL